MEQVCPPNPCIVFSTMNKYVTSERYPGPFSSGLQRNMFPSPHVNGWLKAADHYPTPPQTSRPPDCCPPAWTQSSTCLSFYSMALSVPFPLQMSSAPQQGHSGPLCQDKSLISAKISHSLMQTPLSVSGSCRPLHDSPDTWTCLGWS